MNKYPQFKLSIFASHDLAAVPLSKRVPTLRKPLVLSDHLDRRTVKRRK